MVCTAWPGLCGVVFCSRVYSSSRKLQNYITSPERNPVGIFKIYFSSIIFAMVYFKIFETVICLPCLFVFLVWFCRGTIFTFSRNVL